MKWFDWLCYRWLVLRKCGYVHPQITVAFSAEHIFCTNYTKNPAEITSMKLESGKLVPSCSFVPSMDDDAFTYTGMEVPE